MSKKWTEGIVGYSSYCTFRRLRVLILYGAEFFKISRKLTIFILMVNIGKKVWYLKQWRYIVVTGQGELIRKQWQRIVVFLLFIHRVYERILLFFHDDVVRCILKNRFPRDSISREDFDFLRPIGVRGHDQIPIVRILVVERGVQNGISTAVILKLNTSLDRADVDFHFIGRVYRVVEVQHFRIGERGVARYWRGKVGTVLVWLERLQVVLEAVFLLKKKEMCLVLKLQNQYELDNGQGDIQNKLINKNWEITILHNRHTPGL